MIPQKRPSPKKKAAMPEEWVSVTGSRKRQHKHRDWHNMQYRDGSYWIDAKKATCVIGSGGFSIKQIRKTYAASLRMRRYPPVPDPAVDALRSKAQITMHAENGSNQRQVSISGTLAQVCADLLVTS